MEDTIEEITKKNPVADIEWLGFFFCDKTKLLFWGLCRKHTKKNCSGGLVPCQLYTRKYGFVNLVKHPIVYFVNFVIEKKNLLENNRNGKNESLRNYILSQKKKKKKKN